MRAGGGVGRLLRKTPAVSAGLGVACLGLACVPRPGAALQEQQQHQLCSQPAQSSPVQPSKHSTATACRPPPRAPRCCFSHGASPPSAAAPAVPAARSAISHCATRLVCRPPAGRPAPGRARQRRRLGALRPQAEAHCFCCRRRWLFAGAGAGCHEPGAGRRVSKCALPVRVRPVSALTVQSFYRRRRLHPGRMARVSAREAAVSRAARPQSPGRGPERCCCE